MNRLSGKSASSTKWQDLYKYEQMERKVFDKIKEHEKNKNLDAFFYSCKHVDLAEHQFNKFALQLSYSSNIRKACTFAACIISMIVCLFITLSVLFNKKIREAHPSKIIALISVSEFFTSWSMMIW